MSSMTGIAASSVSLLAAAAMLACAGAAAAEPPCKGMYLLGETVPPQCRSPTGGTLPAYRQWSNGHPAAPSGSAVPPGSLFDRRFQNGYNSAYGLGR